MSYDSQQPLAPSPLPVKDDSARIFKHDAKIMASIRQRFLSQTGNTEADFIRAFPATSFNAVNVSAYRRHDGAKVYRCRYVNKRQQSKYFPPKAKAA